MHDGPLSEPAEPAYAVVLRGVRFDAGGRAVLDDVDMAVPSGSTYALTGGNGAGKSVLLRLVAGLAAPARGTVTVFGEPPGGPEAVAETGIAVPLDLSGTARDALVNVARAQAGDGAPGVAEAVDRRVAHALKRTGLADRADLSASARTSGDLRRLTIASALVTPRALVLLDDPFAGLDAEGVAEVARLCGELSDDGVTLVLASRPHPALDDLATHVGVLRDGRLVTEGPVADVRAAVPPRVTVRTRDVILALGVLRGLGVTDLAAHRDHLTGALPADVPIDRVIRALVHGGVRVTSVTAAPPPYAAP